MVKLSKTMRLCACLLLGSILAPSVACAAAAKLNGPLVEGGAVSSALFSADGSRVIYVADQDTNNVVELYSVPSAGGVPVKLNGPMVSGGSLASIEVAAHPAATRVLYLAAQETPQVFELYSVPIAGGPAVKLNTLLPNGGDVLSMQFSPDGTRVLYRADQGTNDVFEVYQVPATGGAPIKLNGPLVPGADVLAPGLQFSPNGGRVVYLADQSVSQVFELYSVPTTGGTPTKLNGPLPFAGDVSASGLQLSPSGSQVLYLADQVVDEVMELYAVPSAGGTPIKLNGALVNGGDVSPHGLQFSPNGSRVLYAATQETATVSEIFSVPSGGGTPVKLNAPLPFGGNVAGSSSYFTPDSSRVVYIADQEIDNVQELYSVAAAGGSPIKLNGPLVNGGDVSWSSASPEGGRVVYLANQEAITDHELFTVLIAGGPSIKLNAPLVGGGQVLSNSVHFSPDGGRVLFTADPAGSTLPQTYIVPTSGGTPVKLSDRVVTDNAAEGQLPQLSPDGSRVIYRADPDADGIFELYSHVVSQRWVGGAADWDSLANWSHGALPDEAMQIVIDQPVVVNLPAALEDATVNELRLGGGSGNSTLQLETGASLAAINGITILSGGHLQGEGNIEGEVTVMPGGMLAPGSSQGVLEIDSLTMNSNSTLSIELAGTSPGSGYDRLSVGEEAMLGGVLSVALANSFVPGPVHTFTILASTELAGSFSNVASGARLNTLSGEGSFLVNYSSATDLVVLSDFVASQGLLGDYNGNGEIDAADYTVWRDALAAGATTLQNDPTPNTVDQSDFDYWRANFGQSLGSGAGSGTSAVPEPGSIALWLLASAVLLLGGRNARLNRLPAA